MIKYILIIVVALLVLSFFGFNLQSLIQNPTTQSNFSYVWQGITHVWNDYLAKPAYYLWHDIFLNLIWGPALDNLLRLKNNQPTTISDVASSTLSLPMPTQIPQ